jgi:hypothetical protein
MRQFLFAALCAALVLVGCNCPPDEKTDAINLTPEAQAFVAYTGAETLEFVAPDGATLRFTAPRGEEIGEDRLCTRNICTEAKLGSPSSCEYTGAENRRYTFFTTDNGAVLDVLAYTGQSERNSTNWYDAIQVGFSAGTPSTVAHHIIQQRFSGELKRDELGITDFFQPLDSVVVGGVTLRNVLRHQEGGLAVFLQPNKGVIALRANGKDWLLRE